MRNRLLIVPRGIEIKKSIQDLVSLVLLLIVPRGIEIKVRQASS